MNLEPPILITGCARSGTSLVAGIVNVCGAFGGEMSDQTLRNRRGTYENAEIRNQISKPYLRFLGADPEGQNPLPDAASLKPLSGLRFRVETIMLWQGYTEGPWFYKEGGLCLVWPIWHEAFPKAKWIIVRRDDEQIIDSCLRTSFMKGYRTREGWQGWIDEHKKRFDEMKKAGLDVLEVWPAEFVDGNLSLVKHMVNQLGLRYDEKEVRDFITPKLWGDNNGK